ncbi:hypothetical protein [Collimonas pratensis]|uniref:Uncharacterized protein n=1 Tax=Collimonas pratensis TaxID=279113 RepID=A0A127Q0I5_9BURK|nr:hypothetical protein [Collimonas pratensis]AMP03543.1 hypothetical protein CPter91_1159 [Collimonas pratensis]AMP13343.1 hypothetical protein CPter291_1066 [Collimonas pratensis]NKI68051.1 hypothetical protein [Collimonas pratensis]
MNDPLKEQPQAELENPMHHPDEQPSGSEGSPKFGRLLIVLVLVVILIGFITFASEWFYS